MKPKLRREQILRAAIRVFAAKGYHRASVSDIIAAADIARGTFYLYFEGKREIFAELVDVLTVRLINCMKRVELGPEGPPWREQIRANLVRIATVLLEERELTHILYNHAMGLDEEFDQKIREFYRRLTIQTVSALRLGQPMGLVRPDVSVDLAGRYVVGAVKEVIYFLASSPSPEKSAETVVDELLSYSFQGILLPAPDPLPSSAIKQKKKS
jgi:AcrR family transcriptional regulator